MKRKIFTIVLFILSLQLFGQVAENDNQKRILKKAIISRVFVFGKWSEGGGTETHLKYLGKVKTINGQTYKVMTSIYFWGLSRHATSNILIYNNRNDYIGTYNVYTIDDLPTKLENGILIFKNNKECDKNIKNKIDLKNGIPRQFFKKCQGENGDLYNFTNEQK